MEAPKPFAQKNQPAKGGSSAAKPAAPAAPSPAPVKLKIPPLFRKIDWLTMLIAFGMVWIIYHLTLAPEVTLEDSGELSTGAFYAGIPHPPGYPFWSIYSWIWCSLLRVGNVAWRVEVGESTGAAMGCALVALMVSRGSSMIIEGIQDLKGLTAKRENAICLISGAVSGICLGLGGVMWNESVAINRISLFGVPWMMVVLVCLLRWLYAPSQRRYLYWAMFIFGLCSTIHQTLLCAGLGIEVCIAMANPRLGRHFFLFNSFLLSGVVIVKLTGMNSALNVDQTLVLLFQVILVGSVVAYGLLAFLTKESVEELCKDGALAAAFLLAVYGVSQMHKDSDAIYWVLSVAALGAFAYFVVRTHKLGWEWLIVIVCGSLVVLGVAFYLWEPITGMTNPPMEWSYPRTVNGFWRAVHRGQYGDAHPTDLVSSDGLKQFYHQLGILVMGVAEDSNWLLLFAVLVPLLLLLRMKKRERSWIIGLGAIYVCIGILLVILMNPQDDKQSVDLHKVFFTSSHGLLAILSGYGLALITAYMATSYQRFRTVALTLGGLALLPALNGFYNSICNTYFWGGTGLAEFQNVITWFMTVAAAFVLAWVAAQMWQRMTFPASPAPAVPGEGDPKFYFMLSAGGAALMTLLAIYLAFFNDRSLSAGDFLGAIPRMLTLRLANLPAFGGALILAIAVAFLVGVFIYRDRGPVALTLGLFLLMPLGSAMSHWASSEQRNHWFGYWFGHDMFTPPFTGPDGKLTYDPDLRAQALKGTNAELVYPEMARDAILFGGTDPGRFCPTYMIFCESFIPHKDQPVQDQHFDRRDVYIITQNALADDTYLDYLRAQYNRSMQIDPPFFEEALRSADELKYNYTTNKLAALAYRLLDEPLTKMGARVEAKRRAYGLYPAKEIYIPSLTDMNQAFLDYQEDVGQRYRHDNDPRFNGEPRQLRPGEAPTPSPDGLHVQVSGQVSVMAINGYLAKDIFDHNPTNEFYVEESFPLDWMFPYLSPFGDIMKINRQPLAEITPAMIRRDHEFWSHYSDRTVGNWITYDTSVKDITNWIEKVYVQHDFTGFTGDRRFMRDESAQKSFSKLRTAVAGIYAWRLGLRSGVPTPAQYLPKTNEEQARMIKEADFAYRQAFAYCPYSPEVVFNYAVFLATLHHPEDALSIAKTCLRLDPNNDGVANLVRELEGSMKSAGAAPAAPPPVNTAQGQAALAQLESEVRANPTNFPAALALVQAYLKLQQGTKALEVLGAILSNTNADAATINSVAGAYYALKQYPELETSLKRLVVLQSNSPENWYNLACLESDMGKRDDALTDLRNALAENVKELAANPKAPDLRKTAAIDLNFASISNLPEFKALLAAPK